ncbi:MAG: hypothetical protein IJU24_07240 [Bacteroidaceae bacterium]|nr:hypothetical protein [Bacteroidaceae bacterium]
MRTLSLPTAFAVTLSLLFSCKPKPTLQVIETDYLNKAQITIQADTVDVELPLSVHSMIHCDSLNIVIAEDPQGYISVYSQDWQLIDRFGNKGRARNEFLEVPMINSNQIFKGADGHILLPLCETRGRMIKLVDITESMDKHRTVITDSRRFEFGDRHRVYEEETDSYVYYLCDFTFLFLDDNIYHTMETTEASFYDRFKEPIQYRIRYDTAFVEKPDILTAMEELVGPRRQSKFIRTNYRHPKRNLIIELFQYNNYIAFLDLDNNRRYFVHQEGAITFDQEIEKVEINQDGDTFSIPKYRTFTNAITTDSFFMVTYYGSSYFDEDATPELMFFDWEGNFIKSVKLSLAIGCLSYDPNLKTLYGLNIKSDNEELIRFNLSTIIDW